MISAVRKGAIVRREEKGIKEFKSHDYWIIIHVGRIFSEKSQEFVRVLNSIRVSS